MQTYLSPGIYINTNEPRSAIEAVRTDVAAFVGFSEKAQRVEGEGAARRTVGLLNRAQRVESWAQYVAFFGGFVEGAYMPLAVYGYFQNNEGASPCYVVSLRTMSKAKAALFSADGRPRLGVAAMEAGRAGLRLRVQVLEPMMQEPLVGQAVARFDLLVEEEQLSGRWEEKERITGIRIEQVVDENGVAYKRLSFTDHAPQTVQLELISAEADLSAFLPRSQRQRLRITDEVQSLPNREQIMGNAEQRTGLAGLAAIAEITMLCLPDLMASPPNQPLDLRWVARMQSLIVDYCTTMSSCMVILDPPPDLTAQNMRQWQREEAVIDSDLAALYYPWLEIHDPLTKRPIKIPPCGHIAGVWARNDNQIGVHKAPANEPITGVTGLAYASNNGEQASLNPLGINCIRALPGLGIRVWGARTLSSNPAWRYINVRRLFNFVKASIEQGTAWTAFEVNNHDLWATISRDIREFLVLNVWEKGMLAGASPDDAFFVICDERINPPASRDQGILNIEIGLAPIRPAEFITFRLTQNAGG